MVHQNIFKDIIWYRMTYLYSLEFRDTHFNLLVAMASMNGCEDENNFAGVGDYYGRLCLFAYPLCSTGLLSLVFFFW
jgi:hypothetical protein